MTAGRETVSAYRDGEDVTDERMALEEQTEKAISKFLNRGRTDGNRFDLRGNSRCASRKKLMSINKMNKYY